MEMEMEKIYLPWPVYILMLLWLASILAGIIFAFRELYYFFIEKIAKKKAFAESAFATKDKTDKNFMKEVINDVA